MRRFLNLTLLAAAAIAAGCDEPADKEDADMSPAAAASEKKTRIPLDAEIPAKLETATFALG